MELFFNLTLLLFFFPTTVSAAMKSLILPRDCCVFELLIFLGALNEQPPDYQRAPKALRWDVNPYL